MNEEISSKWLLTINNPKNHNLTHEGIYYLVYKKLRLRYLCISTEVSKSGTEHYHVFIYVSGFEKFSKLKSLFPMAHIDICNGSPDEIADYVKKTGKWSGTDKQQTQVENAIFEHGRLPDFNPAMYRPYNAYNSYNSYNTKGKNSKDELLKEIKNTLDNLVTAVTLITHKLSRDE